MFLNQRLGTIAAIWGVGGTVAMLSFAITRMYDHASESLAIPWSMAHYVVAMLWVPFMAYSEGYRGFQRAFSPRVAARAVYLRDRSTPIRLLLAPLFCIAFFDAPRKRRYTVITLTMLIATIVVLFRFIPQPWRGILDLGVIVGLGWGTIATLWFALKNWLSEDAICDAEVPDGREST